jgi:PPOX class probable FMN-dependent enzyme
MSTIPIWRSLVDTALAAGVDDPASRFLQLATIRPDGTPACRTLVFRGFHDQTNDLLLTTDLRSDKVREIKSCPNAEICWYFRETREQFRLSGAIEIIGHEAGGTSCELRLELWQRLSDATRRQFTWPEAGLIPDVEAPLPVFGILLFVPRRVDHLLLTTEPHDRTIYALAPSGEWSAEKIAP